MKKIIKSFTSWFFLIALFEIYMHQIGQDSKSIVLIGLNPILSIISRVDSFFVLWIQVCKSHVEQLQGQFRFIGT